MGAASGETSTAEEVASTELLTFFIRIPPTITRKFVNRMATNARPVRNESPVSTASKTCNARTMVINPRGKIQVINSRSSGRTSFQLQLLDFTASHRAKNSAARIPGITNHNLPNPERSTTTPIRTKKNVRTRNESSEWNDNIFSCGAIRGVNQKPDSVTAFFRAGKLESVSPNPST